MDARVKPGHDAECLASLSDAAFEAGADFFFRQIAADENNAAVANFVGFPGALMIAVQDHVHALEHETLGIVLERQNPLAAQDARPVGGDQILHPCILYPSDAAAD